MKRTVYLHGPLAKEFGSNPVTFEADTFPMLMRGLNSAYPGFLNKLRQGDRMALASVDAGKNVEYFTEDSLRWSLGNKQNFHLATEEHGSAETAIGSFITKYVAAYGTAAYYAAYAVTYVAISLAVSYAMGAIAQSLAKQPGSNKREGSENASQLFDQAVNLEGQGHPIPIVYGRFKVGSVVVSSDISTTKSSISMDDAVQMFSGETKTGNIFNNDVDGSNLILVSFTIDGTEYGPADTYDSGTGLTITIQSNGDYEIVSDEGYTGKTIVVYSASSETTPTTTASMKVEVWPLYGSE